MKTHFLRMMGSFLLFASFIAVLPSCKKENSDSGRSLTGTTYVRIVNAKQGTYPQDFYLNETKINLLPVAYGQPTGYIATNGGSRIAHFNTSETQELVVTAPVNFVSNNYYTVYLTGNTSMYVTFDDMTPPAIGNARVRFIQLSTAAAQSIDVAVGSTKIITGLAYQNISAYSDVNPSAAISIYPAGSSTATLTIPASLQAGKIYTIYISGASTSTLTYNIIAQN